MRSFGLLTAAALLLSPSLARAADAGRPSTTPDDRARPEAPGADGGVVAGRAARASGGDTGDAGTRASGAAADGGVDWARPSTWRLSMKLEASRAGLIESFTRPLPSDGGGVGEAPLTASEAEGLLADPRAQLVYGERTVSIVAPSMLARQRQQHQDLLKQFLKPERLAAGRDFLRAHHETFTRVAAKTKVTPEVIVGILMFETRLGTVTGDYRVFNALASQALFVDEANAVALSRPGEKNSDPERQERRVKNIRERAWRNLAVLVRQCKAQKMDPLEVKGSWAGATGFPQFMPASLRWADDGNGDGAIDLFNVDDAIASVGRYLAEHGFEADAKKAVWGYNHEDAYVRGVLGYAEALKKAAGKPAVRKK